MNNTRLVAKKYADVLVDLAENRDIMLKWEEQLISLKTAFGEDKAKNFFYSELIEPEDKKAVIKKINENVGLSKEIYNLLRILSDKRIFRLLPYITNYFSEELDLIMGREKFTIKTAYPIDNEAKKMIESKIGALLNLPNLVYEYETDKSILGGFVAKSNNLLIDGSTKTHLNKLRKKLLQE